MSWTSLSTRKKAEQESRIPKAWKINLENDSISTDLIAFQSQEWNNVWKRVQTDREIEITTTNDAVDIVGKIRDGVYSSEEVVTAFCKRACVAHQLIFFDEAIERAKALDEDRTAHPEKSLGPLHGLPISLKDTYHVPGVDATIGLACYAFDPSTSYSPLVDILVSLGAVLYCKTNIPQTLMTADSENNLFGRTKNPYNTALTAGGSTGGEGPLIALGGSVLGFGTDIAGSVRIPALCNGIYSFKPSSGMLPFSGQRIPFALGWEGIGIVASAGPMASSVRALNFATGAIMKAVPSNFDPGCLRIHWLGGDEFKRLENPKNLRIGVVRDDGFFTPTPPVERCMDECSAKLFQAGVTLIPVKLPVLDEALPLIGEMLAVNGSAHLMNLIESTGEPLIPSVAKIGLLAGRPKTMGEYFALNSERQEIAKIYSKLWTENKLDAIIMPPAPFTAVPHDEWATATYTAIWNLLDYPCFVLPTGQVDEKDLMDTSRKEFYSEADEKLYKLYTGPEEYKNAPIALQIVGNKQNDQALSVIAGVVDSIVRPKWRFGYNGI